MNESDLLSKVFNVLETMIVKEAEYGNAYGFIQIMYVSIASSLKE